MHRLAGVLVLVSLPLAAGCAQHGAVAARADASRRYDVARLERTFVDWSRPTQPNGEFAGTDRRVLQTHVFHPVETEEAPFPVVVFTHGFTGAALNSVQLLSRIASEGYVVLAADAPLTSRDAPGGPLMIDVHHQPGDVSFLIGQAARLGARGGALAGLVDAERVGVAGHSLGAITSLMAAFHTCCRDHRIDAVVSLAGGAVLAPPGGVWFRGTSTPVLMVHGDADPTVFPGLGRQAYDAANPPKAFLTLVGADHSLPFVGGEPWFDVVAGAVVAFLDAYVAQVDGALTRLSRDANVPGVATFEML